MLTRIRIPEDIADQMYRLKDACCGVPFWRTITERLMAEPGYGLEYGGASSTVPAQDEIMKHVQNINHYLNETDDIPFRTFVESCNWLMTEYELVAREHPGIRRSLVFETTDLVEILKRADDIDADEIDRALA